MMKLAWLIKYTYGEDGEFDTEWQIRFTKPQRYMYSEIIPIVYAELDMGGDS